MNLHPLRRGRISLPRGLVRMAGVVGISFAAGAFFAVGLRLVACAELLCVFVLAGLLILRLP